MLSLGFAIVWGLSWVLFPIIGVVTDTDEE